MGAYRVTAPYVTLKVKDTNGADVVIGFYAGAIVSNADAESIKSHLDRGMVEKVAAAEAPTNADDTGGKASASQSRSSSK